jgi:hypothetical protein
MTTSTSYHKNLPMTGMRWVTEPSIREKSMCKSYIPLVGPAPRPSEVAPKQPQLATTIASPSTISAPILHSQQFTIVGGRCGTIAQPYLSHVFLFSGVTMAQKCREGKIWYFGPKTNSGHTTKLVPLGPLKPFIPRSTRRARAHIPIEQPTTVTLSVRGCFGGLSARGVRGSPAEGRPIHFVPSLDKSFVEAWSWPGTHRLN